MGNKSAKSRDTCEVRAESAANDPRIAEKDHTQCRTCGRDVSAKWNFCPECGKLVILP